MKYALIGIPVFVIIILVMFFMLFLNAHNTEIGLRNQANALQENNKNEFDLMWKKIEQTVQITKAERSSVEKIIIEHAGARNIGGGSLMKMITESIPTIDNTAFLNLQNIVVSARDRFAINQKKLLDLKRAHDDIRTKFPSSVFVGGRPELEVTIVTSARTDESFQTGQDNNVKLEL